MNKVLLVIPENSYKSNDFVIAAKKLELPFSIVTDSEQVSADFTDNIFIVDFSKDITKDLLNKLSDITHVLPVDHSSLIFASKLRDALKSVGNSQISVEAAMNKYTSRKVFNKITGIKINHEYVNSIDDIYKFMSNNSAAVLKPTKGTASNRVIKIEKDNVQNDYIENLINNCSKDELVIEEFIQGSEYAFEGMLINSELYNFVVFDKPLIYKEPFFEESIYLAPSKLTTDEISTVQKILEKASKELGLEHGPIHAEFKIIENEIFIIEINPRMIGGLCSRCLNFGLFKQSQEELILSSFVSNQFKNIELLNKYVGVLMLPVPKSGIFKSINKDEITAIENVSSVEITVSKNSIINMPPDGEKYLGFVFSRGEDDLKVLSALEKSLAVASPVILD
tara:strand:+ start:11752 stop:12936 length:1185 start_codon:yes stop_codon:yes gene_type:complete